MLPEIRYDETNQVLRIKFTEIWGEPDIPELFDRIRKLLKQSSHRFILGDVSEAAPQNYSRKMREMVARETAVLKLDKIAILGANPVLRMMARVLLASIEKKLKLSARFFNTEEEALAWFKEG